MKKKIAKSTASFEDIIRLNGIYVDKTQFVYSLIEDPLSKFYFLARPRRFGKSLMCSTLECLFSGKKELFEGLYISKTDYDFKSFPVLHFDFSDLLTNTYESFYSDFQAKVKDALEMAKIKTRASHPAVMLRNALKKADGQLVIIVDEFDTPITRTLSDVKLMEKIRETFNAFYATLKSNEPKIRFLFITGITKLSNLSIFSALNNLDDISMSAKYNEAFGYTEKEIKNYFSEYIVNQDKEGFYCQLRDYYDGYMFSPDAKECVYNPVSIGSFFSEGGKFRNYWENTAVSTLAIELAKNYNLLEIVEENPRVSLSAFTTFDASLLAKKKLDRSSVYALLFYTGYLTLKDSYEDSAVLGFPNSEVSSSFTKSLLNLYSDGSDIGLLMDDGKVAAKEGDTRKLLIALQDYYEQFPYDLFSRYEDGYQIVFHAFFLPMREAITESHEHRGRADSVIVGEKHIYICELKVDDAAEKAIEQIKEKKYYRKYLKRGATVHLLGISYSSKAKERGIKSYIEEIVDDSEAFSRHSGLIEFSYGKR